MIGVADVDTAFGIRLNGVTAIAVGREGTTDLRPEELMARSGNEPDLRLDTKPVDVAFRPNRSGVVEVRPVLRTADEHTVLRQSVQWTIGLRADVEGAVTWTATGPGPVVIPFDLPVGVALTDLTGPDVAKRSVNGSRVEVWLKKPAKSGTIVWRGTRSVVSDEFRVPVVPGLAETVRIGIRPRTGWTIIVPPAAGVTVETDAAGGFHLTAGGGVNSVRVGVKSPVGGGL